jgi:TatD DNase family protein
MIFVDTHTHIYLEAFDDDREAMLLRSAEVGVQYCFLPDIDSSSRGRMLEVAGAHPAMCFPMAGLHPTSVKENHEEQLHLAYNLLMQGEVIGVGECGIDMYWDKSFLVSQKEVFKAQLQWSLDTGLPVSIHIRDAFSEVFDVLSAFGNTRFRGVFHCFSGGVEEAERAIGYGFHLGIGGVVTYKSSGLPRVLKDILPRHIVLESDAPFLAPAPHRGKRNEPSFLPLIAEKIANVWQMGVGDVAEITTANALGLFKTERSS